MTKEALKLALVEQNIMVVSQDCVERGCMAHDDRVDGPGVVVQPAQQREPVAMYEDWYNPKSCGHCGMVGGHIKTCRHYTTPPQRKPLTDDEIDSVMKSCINDWGLRQFARAIEAAHNIKE